MLKRRTFFGLLAGVATGGVLAKGLRAAKSTVKTYRRDKLTMQSLIRDIDECWHGREFPDTIYAGKSANDRIWGEIRKVNIGRLFTYRQGIGWGPALSGAVIIPDGRLPSNCIRIANTKHPNDPRLNRYVEYADILGGPSVSWAVVIRRCRNC